MPKWTLHDLRRTAKSLMSRAGTGLERIVNPPKGKKVAYLTDARA